METKELTVLEKQYPLFEQCEEMAEKGLPQNEAFAVWTKNIHDGLVLFQSAQGSYSTFMEYSPNFSERNGLSGYYKAPTIQQMEEFVQDKMGWEHNEYDITLKKCCGHIEFITFPKYFNGEYLVCLGDKACHCMINPSDTEPNSMCFPTLAQAYAALCIYILDNFKPVTE